MPIYEYYCPDNHKIYQFYAKTLAQAQRAPVCPDNPRYKLVKVMSAFAISSGQKAGETESASPGTAPGAGDTPAEDARMEAAMSQMEREFANVDENDPRAMGRMMRRMAEVTGEKIDGEMEEVVRKLEEGVDPDSLEEEFGGEAPCGMEDPDGIPGEAKSPDPANSRQRIKVRRRAPIRDPKLYDFE